MTLAILDLETTGTDPAQHHLWEIGLVVRDDAQDDREYCWQVGPDLSTADPMALKIGGYYRRSESLGPGRTYTVVHPDRVDHGRESLHCGVTGSLARELARLLDGAVLAAANVAFDAAFLDRFLRANGQAPAWDYHLLEVESYAAGALGMAPPWRLDALAAGLGVPQPVDRHSALADARLARDVYDAAMVLRRPDRRTGGRL